MSSDLLTRSVVEIHVQKELEEKLKAGKPLRIKFGIDPTGSDLHIGHTVPLRKLKAFQDAGHTIILLIGDYTARIGDPTGKSKTRPVLTEKDIKKNMEHYIDQASRVLDMPQVEVRYNSEWFEKVGMQEILKLCGSTTIAQMLHRNDFKKRMESGTDISLSELLYPLMQGYDSVMLKSDLEIGGTDQLFNLMMGRHLQKVYEQPEQHILTVPILEGTDGVEKMSKSLGNFIGITEDPRQMFGKTMSIPDELLKKYFETATDIHSNEIIEVIAGHPRDAKVRLGYELVKMFHSREDAEHAKEEFFRLFSGGGNTNAIPNDIPEVSLDSGEYSLLDLIAKSNLFSSNSEGRRKAQEGGIKIDGEKVQDLKELFLFETGSEKVFQVGKRKFCRFITS